jgi:hypothetical protein
MSNSVAERTHPKYLASDDRCTYESWRRTISIFYVFVCATLAGASLIAIVVR